MRDYSTIRGGWANVPEGLCCKIQLRELGLCPGKPPVAEVWNSYNWIKLYNIKGKDKSNKIG